MLVPLAFSSPDFIIWNYDVPKVAVLRIVAGLLASVWVVEAAMNYHGGSITAPGKWWRSLKEWVTAEPARIVIVTASVFYGATLLSTLTSLNLHTSLFGRLPNIDGHSLYETTAYFVVFLVIASHLKRWPQMVRLLTAMAATGALVSVQGVLEYYSLDIFGWAPRGGRTASTVGNPIFAGAFVGMTTLATMTLALATWRGEAKSWTPVLWGSLVGIQSLALLLTLSRGAWLGAVAGLALLAVLGFYAFRSRKFVVQPLVVGAVSAVITIAVLASILGAATSGTSGPSEGVGQSIIERAGALQGQLQAGSATGSGRFEIWQVTTALVTGRPDPDSASGLPVALRHLTGYGPDLFQWVFPQEALRETRVARAHNYLLHTAAELGMLGLLALLGLLYAFFSVGIVKLDQGRESMPARHLWLATGAIAIVTVWAVSSVTGIPKASDLLMLWTTLGLFVALPAVMREEPLPQAPSKPRAARSRSASKAGSSSTQVLPLLLAAVAVVAILALTWNKGVSFARSTISATSAVHSIVDGDGDGALRSLDQAIKQAPDVPEYHLWIALIQSAAVGSATSDSRALALAQAAHLSNLSALELNPLSHEATKASAESAAALADLGRPGMRTVSLDLYQQLVGLTPQVWTAHDDLTQAYLDSAQPEEALAQAQRSLSITQDLPESSRAYLLTATALHSLGRQGEAITALEMSLELGGLSEAQLENAMGLRSDIEH